MGTFFVEAMLPNKTTIKALVDTGATFSKFPEAVLRRLGVKPEFTTRVQIGDGRVLKRKVGPMRLRLNGREATVPVMFGKAREAPLIGTTTLEILSLTPDPMGRRLIESPHLEMEGERVGR
jgi:predicted aspartyl protease